MPKPRASGFTLLEVAVVIVVIALIMGGILFGRDLVIGALVKQQISQLESFDSATNSFKLKYSCLPGDCKKAVDLGLGISGGAGDDGNGNGELDVVVHGVRYYYETSTFWQHLSRAQMITGRYTQSVIEDPDFGEIPGIETPPLKLPMQGLEGNRTGGVIVAHKAMMSTLNVPFNNAWLLATTAVDTENPSGYTGMLAFRLDSKVDDGLPNSGQMRAVTNGTGIPCIGGACYMVLDIALGVVAAGDPESCIDDTDSPEIYNTFQAAPSVFSCALIRKTAF